MGWNKIFLRLAVGTQKYLPFPARRKGPTTHRCRSRQQENSPRNPTHINRDQKTKRVAGRGGTDAHARTLHLERGEQLLLELEGQDEERRHENGAHRKERVSGQDEGLG